MAPSASTAARTSSELPLLGSPRLRLLPKPEPLRRPGSSSSPSHATQKSQPPGRARDRAARDSAAVLVAGADPAQRAGVLDQLARTLPASTRFTEAGAVWEVLAHAPSSRIVILSGELDDAPAESLMHTLGHRHPGLPVVSLGPPSPAER